MPRCVLRVTDKFTAALEVIESDGGGLDAFSQSYRNFGLVRAVVDGASGILYREWAPGAEAAFLTGDFNGWSTTACPMTRDSFVRGV